MNVSFWHNYGVWAPAACAYRKKNYKPETSALFYMIAEFIQLGGEAEDTWENLHYGC